MYMFNVYSNEVYYGHCSIYKMGGSGNTFGINLKCNFSTPPK